jgi:hypothetical protein
VVAAVKRGVADYGPGLIELSPTGDQTWLAFQQDGFYKVTRRGAWVQWEPGDEGPYVTEKGSWWWQP